MKKLLVITPRFPYPEIGGDRLRIFQLCKTLSNYYSITLLSLCDKKIEMEMKIPNDGVFNCVERVYLSKYTSYFNCLKSLPTQTPLQVAYYQSPEFSAKVKRLVAVNDISLAHLVRTAEYLKDLDIPKVLEMTDAISMNYERIRAIASISGLKNIIYSLEQKRLKNYEQNIVKKFNLSVLVSQIDKDYLYLGDKDVGKKILVCSNGVNRKMFPFNYQPDGKTIVFIGNMYSVQNLDAVSWFVKNVMPLLLEKGDFVFKIVGQIHSKSKENLSKFPGVKVIGSVENIADAVKGAFVSVCPVRLAAGVQNKVLEYMSLGIPVISSSYGLEGLDIIAGKDALVADKPLEYCKKILRVKLDSDLSKSLSKHGCKYVETKHSWKDRLAPLVKAMQDICE